MIPVAAEVDVVVAGGTTAGAAAALEAAKNGASVYLISSRPYLGVDLCRHYRYWLDEGEEPTDPLAAALFEEPPLQANLYEFSYETDISSNPSSHPDTDPPSLLTDGLWASAALQSVQYDGSVNVIADLGEAKAFESVNIKFYQGSSFKVESVTVYVSNDKQNWQQLALLPNDKIDEGDFRYDSINLTADIGQSRRYVKFFIKKAANVSRVLLAEIQITESIPSSSVRRPPAPMQIKHVLQEALYDAGVTVMTRSCPTDVLHDNEGRVAGVVMANRSGRQAVKAKVVIDATERGVIARAAGAVFSDYPAGTYQFERYVIRGPIRTGAGVIGEYAPANLAAPFSGYYPAIKYTVDIDMPDGSVSSFARAELAARDKTFHIEQIDSSEAVFQVPPDSMTAVSSFTGSWPGADQLDIGVFRPAGINRLYVLSGCADVSRENAEQILKPLNFIQLGRRIGSYASMEAAAVGQPQEVTLQGDSVDASVSGEVRENLTGIRSILRCQPTVPALRRSLPVLAEYDVVVVGGGTGGAPAGIAAARQGASTLVIEYLHDLGGMGTLGLIGEYYAGNRVGFTAEIDNAIADAPALSDRETVWNIEAKKNWYRDQIYNAGGDIWFNTLGCGAFVENGKVKGVVVATEHGRGVVLAKTVIDSTGNSDIAIAAGAEYQYTDSRNTALQGTGLPYRSLTDFRKPFWLTNTDWTLVEHSDMKDTSEISFIAKRMFYNSYDLGQHIQTRECRRIVADLTLQVSDMANDRTYPDTIVRTKGGAYDSHGFTVDPYLSIIVPDHFTGETSIYVPYRSIIPTGLDGILATGLGAGADRDVMPVMRMQADVQNQGYAAGTAAAMAAANGGHTRSIDIDMLQQHLVAKGNLEPEVLNHSDSFPFSASEVQNAVMSMALSPDYSGIEVVTAQPPDSVPLLKQVVNSASVTYEQKLRCAHVLAFLGESDGLDVLLHEIQSYSQWDDGWDWDTSFGITNSRLDSYIMALSHIPDTQALPALLDKLALLEAVSDLSHITSIAHALGAIGDSSAAGPIANILQKSGMMGHHMSNVEEAEGVYVSEVGSFVRKKAIKEISLARALYRCGDYQGIGRSILENYETDRRGHFARHAHAVLDWADMNCDGLVEMSDYAAIASYWLQNCDMCGGSDVNGDRTVDENDLIFLINRWLD
ncbi:3-ketosteroid-delta-1-dehydrogenase [Limihaloglobus sulfuriphilus]|uniref:3-ketosteroid-delta-1-dehydrogenase n=1 Tax=Limihaloglobus sulfuriphilus TaxID=1851148 RepID=A0A1Q2MDT0_9BACT|nr:FAD-dependent oxidoreductase [Limihaloglobus sulfuriphilus]AQQ70863.1 3-ketosteroid-delta-1-dehydrogenase [Limihaloglobus sulfuriphilus]